MCVTLCIISVQDPCSALGFLQTLIFPFICQFWLIILQGWKIRTCTFNAEFLAGWRKEIQTHELHLGEPVPLCYWTPEFLFGLQTASLLRESFMPMEITTGLLLRKETTQKLQSPTQTLQCSQRGGNCAENFGWIFPSASTLTE